MVEPNVTMLRQLGRRIRLRGLLREKPGDLQGFSYSGELAPSGRRALPVHHSARERARFRGLKADHALIVNAWLSENCERSAAALGGSQGDCLQDRLMIA